MRIESFLEQGAAKHGRAVVMTARGCHTLAELDVKSARLAAALQRRGLGRDDRVALLVDDMWSSVLSVFAILKAGGVIAPIDRATDPADLVHALKSHRPVAVITEARLASAAGQALESVPSVRLAVLALGDRTRATDSCLSLEETVNRIGGPPALEPVGDDTDTALVLAGARPLSHRDIIAAAAAKPLAGGTIALPPLVGQDGLAMLVAAIRGGATLVAGSGLGGGWARIGASGAKALAG